MTVIKPNAIAGINSITVASGAALAVHKADGTLIQTIAGTSGVSTFSSVSVGSATTTNDAAKSINIGLGASIAQHVDNSLSFGTGGDERLRITSGGLVGINQNTPTHMLHVDSSNASDSTATAFFKGRIIRFDGAASAHSPRLNLSLDGTDKATILLHRTNDDLEIQTLTASPIRFSPNSTERVRITSGGLVGIGTDTPIEELHITASGYAGQVFQSARTTSTDNIGGPLWHDAGGNVKAKVQATVAGDLKFTSGGSSETARITADGPHLLLGGTSDINEITETSSNAGLVIGGTSYGNGGIAIVNSTSGTGRLYFGDATGSDAARNRGQIYYYQNGDYMMFATAGSERLRITSDGAIGIAGANYGSSGQVLTSQGSGSAVQWATASAGIEMAQHWRLTSSSQGNQTPLTNWEAADNSFAGNLGSSMSVSSGVFTYPSTGIYFVIYTLVGYSDSSTQNLIGSIQQSVDGGSNWGNAAYGLNGIYDYSNSYPSWGNTATHYIFDITDTSQQKTRFIYGAGQGPEYAKGDTNISYTCVTFIRLGDT